MLTGMGELIVVIVLVAIVFGAGKLPQVMEAMGTGVKQFKDAQKAVDDTAKGLVEPRSEDKRG
jgi:sec-independent protein translocase protein TatA